MSTSSHTLTQERFALRAVSRELYSPMPARPASPMRPTQPNQSLARPMSPIAQDLFRLGVSGLSAMGSYDSIACRLPSR